MNVAVIMPVLDEEPAVLEALLAEVKRAFDVESWELFSVVARSTPGVCRAVLHRFGGKVLEQEAPGVGSAYREGIEFALRDPEVTHVLMLDSDGEADPGTIPAMMWKARETKADVVVASRWLPASEIVGYRPDKLVLNWGFNKLFGLLLRSSVHDHTFTFKLMTRDVAESFAWTAEKQDIGSQTTLWPVAAGLKVVEVPTKWQARLGKSQGTLSLRGNVRHVKAGLEALRMRYAH